MMRWIFQLALVGSLLVAGTGTVAIQFSALAGAQEDAPELGVGLPDGIDLQTIASGITETLPAAPANLRLERVTVGAGSDTGLHPAAGPELLFVETGTLLITDEIGIEAAHPEHTQLLVPMGASYGIRNDGGDDAVLLRVGLAFAETDSQSDTVFEVDGVNSETLLQSTVTSLPETPVRVFLARASWESGAGLEHQSFTGPVGLLGEQGTLTVAGPSGIEGQLPEGKGVVFPGGAPGSQRNADADTVVTLMFGIIPASGGLIATTTTEAGETSSPTADQPLTPGVLYEADSSGGFDEWSLTGGWRTFRGMLVNDGGGGTINAPYVPTVSSYAIEAEIQVVPPERNFQFYGFSIGEDSARVSIEPSGSQDEVFFYVGDDLSYHFNDSPDEVDISEDWQMYRLEVDGNRVSLSIDGLLVFEAIDNRLLSISGAPGLLTDGELQANVRSFRIVELAEGSAVDPTDRGETAATGSIADFTLSMDAMAGSTLLAEPTPIHLLTTSPSHGSTVLRGVTPHRLGSFRAAKAAFPFLANVPV